MKTTLFLFLFSAANVCWAANLAIVDSGVDDQNQDLASKMWTDTNGQTTADDSKVYKADTHGWNFADNNNQVIDRSYLGTFSPDCSKFFEIQSRALLGTATQADKDWYNSKKNDKSFMDQLTVFGNFVHGSAS